MPSGGARTRSGPAPDPNALRRDRDRKDWTQLPAAGRQGDTPDWPAEMEEPSVAELAMWQRLWKTPQALVWEADGVHDAVALYVRTFVHVGQGGASAPMLTAVRQQADSLLLTIPALHAARYVIAGTPMAGPVDPEREAAMSRHPAKGPRGSARARLTVVTPDPDADPEV